MNGSIFENKSGCLPKSKPAAFNPNRKRTVK